VILQGTMQDGTVLPVQVDAQGRLVVENRLFQLATAKPATGTAVDFTGIPSWVKRVTVMLDGVSSTGSSLVQVQLGAGSLVTSGYLCTLGQIVDGGGITVVKITSGFGVLGGSPVNLRSGHLLFTNIGGDTWVFSAVGAFSDVSACWYGGGSVQLPGALARVRITTMNGTDALDAGSVNVLCEG
jgi:hypothetical protein